MLCDVAGSHDFIMDLVIPLKASVSTVMETQTSFLKIVVILSSLEQKI